MFLKLMALTLKVITVQYDNNCMKFGTRGWSVDCHNVCILSHKKLPPSLHPTPRTSSAMKTPENSAEGPDPW